MRNRYSITFVISASDEEIAETLGIPIEAVTTDQIREFGNTYIKPAFIAEAEKRIEAGKLTILREI